MKHTLPGQLYITAKKTPTYIDGNVLSYGTPFGFLNPYEPKKASFQKKMETQIVWAYGDYLQNFTWANEQGHLVISGTGWEKSQRVSIRRLADPQPQVWDNTPLTGFKVLNSVSRYSTANKLWRIMDPRGIEFEITTGCMETIINDATILKGGIIDAKCAWLSNKNLVVVD